MHHRLSQAVHLHLHLQWIHVSPQYHIIKPKILPPSDLGSKSKYESHINRFVSPAQEFVPMSLNSSTSSARPHPTFTLKEWLSDTCTTVVRLAFLCYLVCCTVLCAVKLFASLVFYSRGKMLKADGFICEVQGKCINTTEILDAGHDVLAGASTFMS